MLVTRYWPFILRHAWADLRNRYAATSMGIVWNVIHPLVLMAVYSLVFSTIMLVRLPDRPGFSTKLSFVLYLCSGFFPWMAFTECVMRGCTAFVANAGYLKKLPIPEQVFVAQGSTVAAMSLAINFCLLLIVTLALGISPTPYWLLLPIPMMMLLVLGFGIGLLLGTLNAFFRDVGELTGVSLQVLMWLAPIVYTIDILPVSVQKLVQWNPIVPALNAIRDLYLFEQMPGPWAWIKMAIWPVLFGAAGFAALRGLRQEIRDVI
jgi:lipopolysaccharide transport system permease protein